jgi:DNA modification methylase
MGDEKADMVFTDPPYNANYEGRGKNNLGKIQNDNLSNDSFDKFINAFIPPIKTNTKSGGVFYICCNWKDSYPRFFFALLTHGLTISANIVWNKGSGGMGWQDYRYQYEFIIYAISEGHKWYGGRTETDIWDFNRASTAKYTHPTQKPIDLPIKAITNSSKGDDVVLDTFLGSGTTMIACENLGRKCRGCEIDPGYVAVELQRYKDTFPGKEIKLIS